MSESAVNEFNPRLSSADINITPTARDKLIALLADVDDDEINSVRIFVSGGGCGGMSYGMTFASDATPMDGTWSDGDLSVHVDAVALNFLRGVEIDFVDQAMGASFVFNNVFKSVGGSGACGACGSSGGGCA